MSDLSPEAIIAEGIRVYVEGYLDGYGAVEDSPRERAHFATDIAENMAEVLMERLRDAGHTILSTAQMRELIGPSREVDNCPKCNETVEWEKNAYDLRDNDDHRYSWQAYCEACNLHSELIPWPNPPLAAAASPTAHRPEVGQ